jgi:hypothetical protein
VSDLAAALLVAIRVHADQRDKQGEPYLLHVLRVVEAVSDDAKVVAALHDVAEDGGAAGRLLIRDLNLSEVEGVALALLTRDHGCSYNSYIAAIHARPRDDIAREVKLADLKDNLGRIPSEPRLNDDETAYDYWVRDWSGLKRRYEKAIERLEGMS